MQQGVPASLMIMLQVVSWAQQQFLQEVSRDKHDCHINLAKVCMLLALEEEAASQLGSPPSTTTRCALTATVATNGELKQQMQACGRKAPTVAQGSRGLPFLFPLTLFKEVS